MMIMKNYSIWEDLNNKIICPKLEEDLDLDVLIVGGGITGISALFNLAKTKLKVKLIERNRCGYGTTSKSTAKITYLQENIYKYIRNLVDLDTAYKYLDSQREAVNLLKKIIVKNNIACDFQKVDSVLFTNSKTEDIQEEYNFLKNGGVKVKTLDNLNMRKSAIAVTDTYVFHPLKYINYWKEKYQNLIYENTKLESIQYENNYYKCLVNGHLIKCKYLVIASHYPYFLLPFMLPLKSHIETSYIGASKVNNYQDISAINIDKPCISFRYHNDSINNYFIYLYGSYKTADIKDITEDFDSLTKQYKFHYTWTNNDIITHDYMPFIGEIKKNMYIATGYNTWGITNGTLAGQIITDLILQKNNPYKELFNPKRGINLSKIGRLPSDIKANIKAMVKSTKKNVNNKKVIPKTIDGKKVLVYKDKNGKEYIVLDRCPHMKCGIIFNEKEKIWECLCHGSRFQLNGKCINGPSNFDITFK